MNNFKSNSLQSIIEKNDHIFSGFNKRIDDVSTDIRELEGYLSSNSINHKYEFIISNNTPAENNDRKDYRFSIFNSKERYLEEVDGYETIRIIDGTANILKLTWEKCSTTKKFRLLFSEEKQTYTAHHYVIHTPVDTYIEAEAILLADKTVITHKPFIETSASIRLEYAEYMEEFLKGLSMDIYFTDSSTKYRDSDSQFIF
jgi:hypothetical protein